MPLGHESVPGTLCIQNVLATAHQTAGATLAGAPPTARLSKCTISSVTRAWSGMTTLKPQQRSTHVLEHAQTHHGIPLHTKDARNSTSDSARNSRARHPARPSKCTISSTVRARSGTPTPTTTETLHMRASNTIKGIVGFLCTQKVLATAAPARQRAQLSGARHQPLAHPNALSRALDGPGVARPRTQPQKRHARVLSTCRDESRDPFALKRCVLETCCTSKLLAERPTSRPSKPFILSVTRVVSGASTHTCTETLRMLTLAPPKRLPGPLCTQNVLTTYGTSESARISWTSEQPLAHQNAAYRALHRS